MWVSDSPAKPREATLNAILVHNGPLAHPHPSLLR